MKKRVFGVLMAAVLLVMQSATVLAAPSKTALPTSAGDSKAYYDTDDIDLEQWKDKIPDEVHSLIKEVNEAGAGLEKIAEQAPDLKPELDGKRLVTHIFDLFPINGGRPLPDGSHEVTVTVSQLTRNMKNVRIIHYSVERSLWEIITPEKVDYDSKEITAIFKDLSPVAIIADIDESADGADTAAETSPQTGVSSDWMLWMGAAVVLFGMSAAVLKKARA